jgi:uncharacterized membrane-anchored protein
MIQEQEEILQEGVAYRFKTRPIDPVDAFRGRYIILGYDNFELDYAEDSNEFQYGQQVYATLAKDSAGYAYFSELLTNAPSSGDFLLTTCLNYRKGKLRFQIPENMNKYFLNESIAPEAERLYRQFNTERANRDSVFVYVDARILNGNVLLDKVYFKGETVENYIRSVMPK